MAIASGKKFHELAVLVLRFPQRLFRPFALGDVYGDFQPNNPTVHPPDGPISSFVPAAMNCILGFPGIYAARLVAGAKQFLICNELLTSWARHLPMPFKAAHSR